MRDQYGNLALKNEPEQRRKQPVQRIPAQTQNQRKTVETIRIAATPVSSRAQDADERARRIRRELTAVRIKSLVMILSAVVIVTGLFGLMVYRQSMILKDNFANLAITRQINQLKEESGQISERMALRTELELIRTQAVQRLGLQVPARSQIVSVVIPNTDRVVFNSKASAAPDTENYLLSLLFNLEGFFKTLDVKGQD
jgi:hypothetical protein